MTPHAPDLEADVHAAFQDVEEALRALHDAYLEWAGSAEADRTMRGGLLAQAETRLAAAREALDALETTLAEARSKRPPA